MKLLICLFCAPLLLHLSLQAQELPSAGLPDNDLECSTRTICANSPLKPALSPPFIVGFYHTMEVKCEGDVAGVMAEITGEVMDYQWIIPEGAVVHHATFNNILLTLEGSGVFPIKLIVINEAGSDTAATSLNIHSRPKPTLVNTGSELKAGGGSFGYYRWVLHNVQVAYSTENTYIPSVSGWYQVGVYQSPCSGLSDSVYWEALSIPNFPAADKSPFSISGQKLKSHLTSAQQVTILVFDANGTVKHRYSGILKEIHQLPDMAAGNYFVLLNYEHNKRFVLRWQVP